jgi:hypothetical protein
LLPWAMNVALPPSVDSIPALLCVSVPRLARRGGWQNLFLSPAFTCRLSTASPPFRSTLFFSINYGLFVVLQKVNSFAIKQIRTLLQKHPGWGGCQQIRPFGISNFRTLFSRPVATIATGSVLGSEMTAEPFIRAGLSAETSCPLGPGCQLQRDDYKPPRNYFLPAQCPPCLSGPSSAPFFSDRTTHYSLPTVFPHYSLATTPVTLPSLLAAESPPAAAGVQLRTCSASEHFAPRCGPPCASLSPWSSPRSAG